LVEARDGAITRRRKWARGYGARYISQSTKKETGRGPFTWYRTGAAV